MPRNRLPGDAPGNDGDVTLEEVARVSLPTRYGTFSLRAFEPPSGHVHLALAMGDIEGDGGPVLTRVHSECLTGDALGSLRCDCGIQLRTSVTAIAAEGRGVLVYATGHEGRGIGLANKLRAYVEQDLGADTVDANLHLGLPVDRRDYAEAATVLSTLGVRSVRLMTSNPRKVEALERAGIEVAVAPVTIEPHVRNLRYLATKRDRLGHLPADNGSRPMSRQASVSDLLGGVRSHKSRPHVVLKYAQSIDGRIATTSGDARWISGEEERMLSHALRARCDAVMVGIGTVLQDDPQLTVRLVAGESPIRIVLDSRLRIPLDARVLDDDAATMILTTELSDPRKRSKLRDANVAVRVIPRGPGGVDVRSALAVLRSVGVELLLAEGGAGVITTLLAAGVVDRMIVAFAPLVLGEGVEAVGQLGIERVAQGLALRNRSVQIAGSDVLIASDVETAPATDQQIVHSRSAR